MSHAYGPDPGAPVQGAPGQYPPQQTTYGQPISSPPAYGPPGAYGQPVSSPPTYGQPVSTPPAYGPPGGYGQPVSSPPAYGPPPGHRPPAPYGQPVSTPPAYGQAPQAYAPPISTPPAYGPPPPGYGPPTSAPPTYGQAAPSYGPPASAPPGYGQAAPAHGYSVPALQPAQVAGATRCRLCGWVPAAPVTFRGHQGMIVLMRFLRLEGPFCRRCGLATFRRMTSNTMWQGWWGYASFIITPITVLINLVRRGKVASLPEPQPFPYGQNGTPADPGPSLLARPGTLVGLIIPVALFIILVLAIVAGSTSP